MTASTEGGAPSASGEKGQPFEAAWRARRAREQEAALPGGSLALSCTAAFGIGGLGRHLQEIAQAQERRGEAVSCLCGAAVAGGVGAHALTALTRRSAGWRMWSASSSFDTAAARKRPRGEHLIAFSGQALRQLRAARSDGVGSASIVSPTSHLRQVADRYEEACRRHPLEGPWTQRILKRSLAEYELADHIYVSSEYVWESFVREGFSEEVLRMLPLTPDPRFAARPSSPPEGSTFEVLYVGSLSVVKGVPLLIEAMQKLEARDLRLVLQGGWESRGMRRYLERACAADQRIEIRGGDPLGSMSTAALHVHPSHEDGFSYSSAEALACGVPVIVSENTGMKELIDVGRTGVVLARGDVDALTDAISAAYRGELLHG